ncbi:srs domain-containing protein [Neospora caninum Liverpool]|uniref:Srs domain-containing protein n=1 Tax=Neospora caninum (strain Liverpool) TaxID=572307 RepID=F0V8B8_NEOCL|nr:srs domain-containing protein [Neospora caninum Liverpool]CBZ49959.1 srs domain-containing protein [Neospora caninum Liverpool]CEL64547.1 TPA: SRS domain-containing protein [Neospora caninum Liverpool]|eukprot:XP_003879994.1 srs domain-containing protein [Neospora caninum Liverpool]
MARTSRMAHRCGGIRSKARKLMAVCMGGVLLFSGGGAVSAESVEGLLRRNLVSSPRDTGAETDTVENVATCTLEENPVSVRASSSSLTLSLSQGTLSATVQCQGDGYTFVPSEETHVCGAHAAGSKGGSGAVSCNIGSDNMGNPVTLQHLLGTSNTVQWTKKALSHNENQGEQRTLTLTQADLPRTDKSFMVGCQKSAKSPCKVTVNVNARPSSVDDKNVVTCAYGKDSNPKPVEVEMSEDKNTLTIDCGTNASMYPQDYTSHYCAPESESKEQCIKKNYSDVLGTFDSSWWSTQQNGISATLTIPKTDFPPEDQSLLVACVPESLSTENTKKANSIPHSVTGITACRVLVTVKKANSASTASPSPHAIATASGAALLAGFLAGSF